MGSALRNDVSIIPFNTDFFGPEWAQSAVLVLFFISDGCLIDPPITDYFECRASVNGFCCKCGPCVGISFPTIFVWSAI